MNKTPRTVLHLNFSKSATPKPQPETVPQPIKRQDRGAPSGDPQMRNYMINLESRLLHHVQRHAKGWVAKETNTILRRWNAPILKVPSPRWAPPRDVVRDAGRYAEELVLGRVQARLMQFHAIRQSRGIAHDPLGDRLRAVQSPTIKSPTQKPRQ